MVKEKGRSIGCTKAQRWVRLRWSGAQVMEEPEGCWEDLSLSDMELCKVWGQREEFYTETIIWKKRN